MGSKKFTLNWADISKIGKNAILVGSAAVLTYLSQNMEDINMGAMAALFVPIVAAGLDTAIKWLKSNHEE
jgi:hypothetical protein|tara:strand:+ start:550 stop:759 length:210 start_codon:yes stop_codon:yes gene_type:complete